MKAKRRTPRSAGPTEESHPRTRGIDSASPLQIARAFNREDRKIARAVGSQLKEVARAIELGAAALSEGGRLFYVGAGSSGRLGVLDAAECPPTFGVPSRLVQAVLAGGKRALWRAAEGAEDDASAGARAISRAGVGPVDWVLGITASGRTPFVKGALKEAGRKKARCLLLSCNPEPEAAPLAEVVINPVVGPEVIAGSTRLKAGTATKMVLNMISTGIMIRRGKVYGNLMVDVKPSSGKLRDRAERIVVSALQCSRPRARGLLRKSGNRPKVAIVMGAKGCSAAEARALLDEKGGFLGEVL